VDEYTLLKGANITQMHILQRRGARYHSSSEGLDSCGAAIVNATSKEIVFQGKLDFLNDWSYKLDKEILVSQGRQELFDACPKYYNYGHLYNNDNNNSTSKSKLVVRTTLQSRMLESCENFFTGYFGLNWRDHAKFQLAPGWPLISRSPEPPS
jgi:hypothetical protein